MSLFSFLRLRTSAGAASQSAPRGPVVFDPPQPDRPVYVVGDIHGRIDLLDRLLALIETDAATLGHPAAPMLVLVGDYIDRGDDSAAVLSRAFALQTERPDSVVCLLGNHEKMMLDFIDTPARGPRWLRNGGLQTLMSLGLGGVLADGMSDEELAALSVDLHRALPDGIEDWLRGLPLVWNSGNLWVTHAGADPSVAMPDQTRRVMLWGHRDFDAVPRQDGQWVAHGHFVFDTPSAKDGRIATDTGGVYTGRLTAARIVPGAVSFLST